MQMLNDGPAAAYRRVDLDARIEASSREHLTLICLEEAVAALAQALLALEREPDRVPSEPLARAQGIAVWLARSVAPENPLYEPMKQFYGGIARTLTRNMRRAYFGELSQVREHFTDLLDAVKAA